jgi:6-phosphogluconolactonase
MLYTSNVAQTASELFIEHLHRSIAERGRFVVVLSGGSTPLKMYELLKTQPLPWDKVQVFWGDERFVPHDHPDSNYAAAKKAFLDVTNIPQTNIYPMPYGQNIQQAATSYAREITNTLGESPIFDLTFLGLGDDAHIASLFPGTGAVFAQGLVTVCNPNTAKHPRLSLTSSALSQSRTVVFLVSGESKRKALTETLEGQNNLDRYPARSIKAIDQVLWITDLQL